MRKLILILILLIANTKSGWALQIDPVENARLQAGTTVHIVVKPDTNENWKAIFFGVDRLQYDMSQKAYVGEMTLPQDEELGFVELSIIAVDYAGKETEFIRSVEILPPSGVTLKGLRIRDDQKTLFIRAGRKEKIDLYGQYSDGIERYLSGASSAITFTSSDEKVATVANDGLVTAISVGQSKVTISIGNKKLVIIISVKPKK